MTLIPQQALSEVELLKEIYKKLAGENPALDLNKALSKAQLLRAIANLAQPIADPNEHFGVLASIYEKLAGEAYEGNETTAAILAAIADLDLGGGGSLTIVEDIPEQLLPGQKVWCVATQSEWIGADPDNGIFPTLAEGTPWPLVGYKSVVFKIKYHSTVGLNINYLKKEVPDFSVTRVHEGFYMSSNVPYDVSVINVCNIVNGTTIDAFIDDGEVDVANTLIISFKDNTSPVDINDYRAPYFYLSIYPPQ